MGKLKLLAILCLQTEEEREECMYACMLVLSLFLYSYSPGSLPRKLSTHHGQVFTPQLTQSRKFFTDMPIFHIFLDSVTLTINTEIVCLVLISTSFSSLKQAASQPQVTLQRIPSWMKRILAGIWQSVWDHRGTKFGPIIKHSLIRFQQAWNSST